MDNINIGTIKRAGAFIIDFSLVQGIASGLVMVVTTFAHITLNMKDMATFMTMYAFVSIFGGLYALLCKKYFGRTLGKGVLNLMVVDNNAKELDYAQTFSRETSKWIIAMLSPAGYFVVCGIFQFFGKKTPHDLLAKTDVIFKEK